MPGVAEFLASLGNPGQQPVSTYGMAPAMAQSLAMNKIALPQQAQQPAPPQASQPPARQRPGGVRNFLGHLGDALLVGSGGEPVYAPQQERAALGEQLAQYLGVNNPQLAELLASNPEAGMALYNALREDKRFERSAGQDDRRVAIAEGQLGLGNKELAERIRSNQAGEGITQRGQDISSTTQVRLQQMRQQEAAAGRAHDEAMRRGDRAHAERMLGLQQQFQREIKALEGGGPNGYTETTVTTPGSDAVDGWFTDTPATPETRTVTRTPNTAPTSVTTQAQIDALPKGRTFVWTDGKTYRKD